MLTIKRKFLVSVVFVLALIPKAHSNQLEEIPLDSWIYPVIDELHFQGFFPKLFVADKPYTRGEISAYLITVLQGYSDGTLHLKPHQKWLFERLHYEFRFDFVSEKNESAKNLRLNFRWGSTFNLKSDFHKEEEPFHKPVFNAYAGVELEDRFYFRTRARVENHVSQNPSVRARAWTRNDLGGTLDDTYLKCHHKYFDLIFGRQRLQWGPGFAEVDLISPTRPPSTCFGLKQLIKISVFNFFLTVWTTP